METATRRPGAPKQHPPSVEQCQFGPWKLSASKSHILASEGPDRQQFESSLKLPSFPEMIFDKNILRLEHAGGFGIEFNARDALAKVDAENDTLKVANAQEWAQARSNCEHIGTIIKPFDWTFTTDYTGTLFSRSSEAHLQVEETNERIDLEKLKGRERIHFYTDLLLFEDELHDNGCSILNVKIRVMPTFFFALMRLYMRVDNVLVRINDTRLFHEVGTNHILREFTARENKYTEIRVPGHLMTDPNEIADKIAIKHAVYEKLSFPQGFENISAPLSEPSGDSTEQIEEQITQESVSR